MSLLPLLCATGCAVHVYQPLSGLHRPIVVDTGLRNFEDLSITVHCDAGDHLSRMQNITLCRQVSTLFENQGATVTTIDAVGQAVDPFAQLSAQAVAEPVVKTDLVLHMKARRVSKTNSTLSWVLCLATYSLLPAVDEETFAQDITIRDGNGFLLVQDSLEGRIIRRSGAGAWFGNGLMNWLVRDDDNKLGKETAGQDLSEDLYGQLSQMVYNAKSRWTVLQEATPGPIEADTQPKKRRGGPW